MAWEPAEIKTKLLDSAAPKPHEVGYNVLSCEYAVKEMFRQLGREARTHGSWKHGLMG